MAPKITFHNQPKLSEHEADKTFNERRVVLAGQVKEFIAAHSRFEGADVSITFAEKGISSLIAIIETPHEKLVLKIPLSLAYSEGEALFLKTWEEAGVKVPHVIEDGMLGGHSYALMEYIDAPLVMDAYTPEELSVKGIYREMGRTLRHMHTPEAHGYGRVMDGKPKFAHFSEWLLSPTLRSEVYN